MTCPRQRLGVDGDGGPSIQSEDRADLDPRHPAVSFVSCTTGRYDLLASIEAESKEGLYELVEEQLAHMEDIKDCELFISEEFRYGPIWSGCGILSSFR